MRDRHSQRQSPRGGAPFPGMQKHRFPQVRIMPNSHPHPSQSIRGHYTFDACGTSLPGACVAGGGAAAISSPERPPPSTQMCSCSCSPPTTRSFTRCVMLLLAGGGGVWFTLATRMASLCGHVDPSSCCLPPLRISSIGWIWMLSKHRAGRLSKRLEIGRSFSFQ